MGSAVGLPAAALATVLGTIGFGIGQEIDTAINSPSKYEQSSGNSETAGTRESNQRCEHTATQYGTSSGLRAAFRFHIIRGRRNIAISRRCSNPYRCDGI